MSRGRGQGWSSQRPAVLVLALLFIPEQLENNEGLSREYVQQLHPVLSQSKRYAAMGALGNRLI